jgi:hypothetical protein
MSSFLDKAKDVAQQAIDEARKGLDQGQTKLDEYQAKRHTEQLLTDLGAAYYAEQRWSGGHDAVEQALAAVDEHARAVGLLGFPDSAVTPGPSTTDGPAASHDTPPATDPGTAPPVS